MRCVRPVGRGRLRGEMMRTLSSLAVKVLALAVASGSASWSIGQETDPAPRVAFEQSAGRTFGICVIRDMDGKPRASAKKLTFLADGATNSTMVRIDGKASVFGGPEGSGQQRF